MNGEKTSVSGSLVSAGRRDLAPLAAANPLVSRGLADLAIIQEGILLPGFEDTVQQAHLKYFAKGFELGKALRTAQLRAAKGPQPPQSHPGEGTP